MKVNTKILAFIVIMIGFLYSNPITTIAVLDLEARGMSTSEAAILTDRLRSTLIKVGQYTVVDRANMEEVLTEQGFQQTGCTSDECVAEVGKLLGVQHMVSGSLGRFGKAYTIQLQILNVETGAIEQSSTYDYEGEIENLLKEGIQTALLRLLGLEDSPTAFSATSIKNPGVLIVSSDPTEAMVKMDGYEIGTTPLTNTGVMPGAHIIAVKKDRYDEAVKTIVVGSGKTVRESFELIRSTGIVELSVSPSESTVEIDGVKYSTDEAKILGIPTGDHSIKVTAQYYYPYTTEINLQKDTSMPLAVNLKSGKEEFERLQKRKKLNRALTAASIVTTLASALLAESVYTKYNDATSQNDAQSYRTTTETIDTITIGLSAISIGVTAYTYLTYIKDNKLKMTLGVM
ncbi:MAG: PEGA domain-containing protein [Candidatus Marinimicrobia bacterium]|nr:PEGA domain-containing protein [Candidatus Neomarinimicrobiota bacterium]MBL7047272.1 PEGA domain-containing protein [Candidatus Neomarinimicrobiota bacterium]